VFQAGSRVGIYKKTARRPGRQNNDRCFIGEENQICIYTLYPGHLEQNERTVKKEHLKS